MRNRSIVLAVRDGFWAPVDGSALAQETPAAAPAVSATGVEEVVVHGSASRGVAAGRPIAVTALSGDQLAESQILAVKDVAAIAPGLNINSTRSVAPSFRSAASARR
jgi:hypothetical protein